jgi:hypothetical protein
VTDGKVSTTDAEAAPRCKGGIATLGYHDHSVVDGGKARIILAALVTPADVPDNQALIDLLDRVRFRSHLHGARVIADGLDAPGEHLRALAEPGITASLPVVDHEQSPPFFRHKDCTYDPQSDT